MSTVTHLNLARKWRAQRFEQIIGQDLCVRMLKNSLYLDHLFPVYLFSGQRGCGKTSMARIFASAINCEKFQQFKVEPKKAVVPCLSCFSCCAMLEGKHPDFIEMDAASHTGVDNVRAIIDAASLMPIMGRKKIYLIDEAHMLSKPALNAFLKILEEPPASVLFILATTDPQKIIETVRSRCFQLFVKSIETPVLLHHLQEICQKEGIAYQQDGLELIIKETQGSARDALNMLESVRFVSSQVNKQTVMQVLGHVDEDTILNLFEMVLRGKYDKIIEICSGIDSSQRTVTFLWQTFVQLVHASIWLKHGVQPDAFTDHTQRLKHILRRIDWLKLQNYLKVCYENELTFLKTTNQHAFFVMILLQLSLMSGADDESGSGSSCASTLAVSVVPQECVEEEEEDNDEQDGLADFKNNWNRCITDVVALNDPLLASVFKQGQCTAYDEQTGNLHITFSKNFSFFKDVLDKNQALLAKVLEQHFGRQVTFNAQFTNDDAQQVTAKKVEQPVTLQKTSSLELKRSNVVTVQKSAERTSYGSYTKKKVVQEAVLDVKNKQEWQKTHLLLNYFPGTVYLMQEARS